MVQKILNFELWAFTSVENLQDEVLSRCAHVHVVWELDLLGKLT